MLEGRGRGIIKRGSREGGPKRLRGRGRNMQ